MAARTFTTRAFEKLYAVTCGCVDFRGIITIVDGRLLVVHSKSSAVGNGGIVVLSDWVLGHVGDLVADLPGKEELGDLECWVYPNKRSYSDSGGG